jgi:hypothetical protein
VSKLSFRIGSFVFHALPLMRDIHLGQEWGRLHSVLKFGPTSVAGASRSVLSRLWSQFAAFLEGHRMVPISILYHINCMIELRYTILLYIIGKAILDLRFTCNRHVESHGSNSVSGWSIDRKSSNRGPDARLRFALRPGDPGGSSTSRLVL